MSYTQNPRYLLLPENGGPEVVPSREEQVIAYAASVALATTQEKTIVLLGTITGALALTIGVTAGTPGEPGTGCFDGDELLIKMPSDSTGRTITFSTGFTPIASTLVLASNQVGVSRFVYDGATSKWIELSRNINVPALSASQTWTGSNKFSEPVLTDIAAPAAINSTGTATAAQMIAGVITSTSAAGTTITTPTATAIATAAGLGAGSSMDFVVDNSAGSSTVTVSLDASIVALAVVTGGNTLTIASGKVGIFRLYFTSGTAAFIARLA